MCPATMALTRRKLPLVALIACCLLTACGGGGSSNGASGGANVVPQSVTPSGSTPQPPSDEQIDPEENDDQDTVITILGLVTNDLDERFLDPEMRVQHLLNVANDAIAASGISLQLVFSDIRRVDYPSGYSSPTALEHVTLEQDAAFAGIGDLRDELQSDLVVLFRPYANDGYCGYAWMGGAGTNGDFSDPAMDDFGYSVVVATCNDYVLLHEIGHNLGLDHSRRESPVGGSLPYGVGYGIDNGFVTIMATPSSFNGTQLPILSSPDYVCAGEPCGIDSSDPVNGADAVSAVKVTMPQVASYR